MKIIKLITIKKQFFLLTNILFLIIKSLVKLPTQKNEFNLIKEKLLNYLYAFKSKALILIQKFFFKKS